MGLFFIVFGIISVLVFIGIVVSWTQSILSHFEKKRNNEVKRYLDTIDKQIDLIDKKKELKKHLENGNQDVVYSVRETDSAHSEIELLDENELLEGALKEADDFRLQSSLSDKMKNSGVTFFKALMVIIGIMMLGATSGYLVFMFLV